MFLIKYIHKIDMKFSFRQLEVFVAVARTGSVSAASQQLSMSQSAASTALAELERQFDCQLFDRQGRRVHLNPLGRSLLPEAAALLDRGQGIEALLSGRRLQADLRIGASLTIGNYLAPGLLAGFMNDHPDIRCRLDVANTARVVEALASFDIDLGLIEGECDHPDLLVIHWAEDELAVFCAPDHPFADGRIVEPEALAREDWILRERGSGTRLTMDHAFRHLKTRLGVRFELAHTEGVKRAVEKGLGLGCISRVALTEAFRRGSLVEVNTPGLDLKRDFWIVRHRHRYSGAAIEAVVAYCQEMANRLATF
jgi:DNA-binding transcriptional LysR family regulator